mmetsp:Transcript_56415/g.98582  ORF Transcript_56415/g.98582 Transcript_56415/m.98582 type:complete len:109 (+) Transcript_56415:2-328(+)
MCLYCRVRCDGKDAKLVLLQSVQSESSGSPKSSPASASSKSSGGKRRCRKACKMRNEEKLVKAIKNHINCPCLSSGAAFLPQKVDNAQPDKTPTGTDDKYIGAKVIAT